MTAVFFALGKFVLGLYLGSGAAGSADGAASSLITLLLWIYYAAQILLFGAEFTQVYANTCGTRVEPQAHAVKVEITEKVVTNEPEILFIPEIWPGLLERRERSRPPVLQSSSTRQHG